MKITDENIELLLFRYKEGLLSPEQAAEVEQQLALHPDWRALADGYDPSLTLPAGATLPYAGWQSLRNGGPKAARPRRVIPLWSKISIAACLLLGIATVAHFVSRPADDGSRTLIAKTRLDTIPVAPAAVADTMLPPSTPAAAPRAVSPADATLLADATASKKAAASQPKPQAQPEPALATPDGDTTRYPIDKSISRELNDPMDQEVLYASLHDTDEESDNTTVIRHEQLRNIEQRTALLIATTKASFKERREAAANIIEANLLSNKLLDNKIPSELMNNIIASIE